MELISTIIAFLVALGGLVAIHEWGHFWMARRFDIRVLRFSIGFGNPLWRRKGADGTDYWLSVIPLGGYVKLLDAREQAVAEADMPYEFSSRPVHQRLLVFLAGPCINLVFAWLLYWLLFMHGTQTLVPKIGLVIPESIAAQVDLPEEAEIIAVGDQITPDWEAVNLALAGYIGLSTQIPVRVLLSDSGGENPREQSYQIPVKRFMSSQSGQSPVESLGILPAFPDVPAIIGRVLPEGAASRAGLQSGDRVQSVDGQGIRGWQHWVQWIRTHPDIEVEVVFERNGQWQTTELRPDTILDNSKRSVGRVGAELAQSMRDELVMIAQDSAAKANNTDWYRTHHYGPVSAAFKALRSLSDRIVLTLQTLKKMLLGVMSLDNLSGPLTIAQVAGDSARYGAETFFQFVAYLSLSLGVLNLLPIPVLDGGHILFAGIEWLRGKPLSERIQQISLSAGAAMLVLVMGIALYNDLTRLVL